MTTPEEPTTTPEDTTPENTTPDEPTTPEDVIAADTSLEDAPLVVTTTTPEDEQPTTEPTSKPFVFSRAREQAAAAEAAAAEDAATRFPTLEDLMKRYDWQTNPHPWIHKMKAVPMGTNGEVPMVHDIQRLNLIAIHMERLGFTEPETDNIQIKYVPPLEGPDIVINPGTWVPIDAEVAGAAEPAKEISLEGVPPNQLEIIQRAVAAEHLRLAKIAGADPIARSEAEDTIGTTEVTPDDLT